MIDRVLLRRYTWGVPRPTLPLLVCTTVLLACTAGFGQAGPPAGTAAPGGQSHPVTPQMPPRSLKGLTEPADPENPTPAGRDFKDPRYHVSFHIPAGWNFEKKDGLISNFGVETRTARARSDVRGVAELNFNPWPPTTFSGALFYYSVLPDATAARCSAQTSTRGMKPLPKADISGIAFQHGRDNHGTVCTEARDEAFTAMRGSACLRFDLVINTFCGETSGAMDMTPDQIKDIQTRLAGILGSVKIGR